MASNGIDTLWCSIKIDRLLYHCVILFWIKHYTCSELTLLVCGHHRITNRGEKCKTLLNVWFPRFWWTCHFYMTSHSSDYRYLKSKIPMDRRADRSNWPWRPVPRKQTIWQCDVNLSWPWPECSILSGSDRNLLWRGPNICCCVCNKQTPQIKQCFLQRTLQEELVANVHFLVGAIHRTYECLVGQWFEFETIASRRESSPVGLAMVWLISLSETWLRQFNGTWELQDFPLLKRYWAQLVWTNQTTNSLNTLRVFFSMLGHVGSIFDRSWPLSIADLFLVA